MTEFYITHVSCLLLFRNDMHLLKYHALSSINSKNVLFCACDLGTLVELVTVLHFIHNCLELNKVHVTNVWPCKR